MGITLKDVASRAGVSVGCVSQVLNGRGQLRPETRQRILAAVRELGYRPNISARAVRRGRFNSVALLCSTNRRLSFLPIGLLDSLLAEVDRHGMHLVVASLADEKLTSRGYVPRILREYLADPGRELQPRVLPFEFIEGETAVPPRPAPPQPRR